MAKNGTALAIVIIIVLFFLFSGFSMIDFNLYGFSTMCTHIGGIWCYWPVGELRILIMIISFLVITALLLFVLWLINQLQSQRRK